MAVSNLRVGQHKTRNITSARTDRHARSATVTAAAAAATAAQVAGTRTTGLHCGTDLGLKQSTISFEPMTYAALPQFRKTRSAVAVCPRVVLSRTVLVVLDWSTIGSPAQKVLLPVIKEATFPLVSTGVLSNTNEPTRRAFALAACHIGHSSSCFCYTMGQKQLQLQVMQAVISSGKLSPAEVTPTKRELYIHILGVLVLLSIIWRRQRWHILVNLVPVLQQRDEWFVRDEWCHL